MFKSGLAPLLCSLRSFGSTPLPCDGLTKMGEILPALGSFFSTDGRRRWASSALLPSSLPHSINTNTNTSVRNRDVRRSFTSSVPLYQVASTEKDDDEEETLEQIQSRIFGTHIGTGQRSGRKILKRPLLGPKIASYYLEDIAKIDPFMISLKAERYVLFVVFSLFLYLQLVH